VRQRFIVVLMLLSTFLVAGHLSSLATQTSSASSHGCASPIPPSVPGSPLPAPSIPGKILINGVLTSPGSRWNCSDPANMYTTGTDSWIELYNRSPILGQIWASHIHPVGSCFTAGSFTEPSHDGSARAALSDRRFTLPEELPVGTWLAAQIQDRQRCQVQRGIEIAIDHQPTGRILADIDAL